MAFCSIAMALGIVGVLALVRRLAWHGYHRHAYAFGGPWGGHGCGPRSHGPDFGPPWSMGGGGWGPTEGRGRGRWGSRDELRGFGRKRSFLRMLSERLQATPAQEREIEAAFTDLRAVTKEAREALRTARENVARGFEGDTVDEIALGDASVSFDAQAAKTKEAFEAALRRVHAVLEPEQRRVFAELLASGPWGGRGGFGPYRS